MRLIILVCACLAIGCASTAPGLVPISEPVETPAQRRERVAAQDASPAQPRAYRTVVVRMLSQPDRVIDSVIMVSTVDGVKRVNRLGVIVAEGPSDFLTVGDQ